MTEDNICIHCKQAFKSTRNDANFCSSKCRQAAYRVRSEEKEARTLFTIGYEGIRLPDFIKVLKANKIKHLLDVRESTKSGQKSEFSEYILSHTFKNGGITYHSNKSLGDPENIKKPYLTNKILTPEFEIQYREHLAGIDMKELACEIKQFGRTALLCYEKFAIGNKMVLKGKGKDKKKFKINCHRGILANVLKETGEFDEIIHL